MISRSGTSKSVHSLIDRAAEKTDVPIIGFTSREESDKQFFTTELDAVLDTIIPLPLVGERIKPYATRSVVLQMAVLQCVILEDDPDPETMEQRFAHVEAFIHDQLRFVDDGEDEDDGLELDDGRITRLDAASQLSRTADALERSDDLASDALVASLGHYHPLGREAAQTHHGFLHTHSEHVNLGSIRHSQLNVLYRGNAYLITALPDSETEAEAYERCYDYLYGHKTSIYEFLIRASDSPGLRLVVFSFNKENRDTVIETETRKRSKYQNAAAIYLPDRSEDEMNGFANDVTLVVANYLLVYALLDRRWEQDAQLRNEVMSGPRDRRIQS